MKGLTTNSLACPKHIWILIKRAFFLRHVYFLIVSHSNGVETVSVDIWAFSIEAEKVSV